MTTPIFIKSFRAESAIEGYLIVTASADNKVRVAQAATEPLLGAAGSMGARIEAMLDVDMAGWSEVRAGGDVDFGDPLTSDANGKAIKAVAVKGSLIRIIGYAMGDAQDGDIFPYFISHGLLNTPA